MRFRPLAVAAAFLAVAAPAGAANPQEAGLQVALRAQGLYAGPIDAVVGARTVGAVRAFQQLQGLPESGRADARTRAALGPLGRPIFGARTLRRGMFGWDVAVLQYLLVRRGLRPPINGYLDAPTEQALRLYQRRLRLSADGVAGPVTLASFGSRAPVPAVSRVRGTRVYVVRPGDTLTGIARRRGTTVGSLARLNRLDPARVLVAGARLRLPAAVRIVSAARAPGAMAVRRSLGRWAARYGVDPRLARAVAWMESGFQQRAVSPVGAQGVMQLLPSTWSYGEDVLVGHSVPHTADGNVRIGVAYLHHLLRDFGGDERLALAGWYQGESSVRAHGLYGETRTFVADVLALRRRM